MRCDKQLTESDVSKKIFLAPMVRGSELAMRMLCRKYGVLTCYSPMLRDHLVLDAYRQWQSQENKNEKKCKNDNKLSDDGYLLLKDTCPQDHPLVIQLSGRCPNTLGAAVAAVLEIFDQKQGILPAGIDLNLGCPQECAEKEAFGAFLAEREPERAVACVRAMREAIDKYQSTAASGTTLPGLSCKIRLLDDDEGGYSRTADFARKLQNAGCGLLAVHCRRRKDKHGGLPDLAAGAKLVRSLNIPVVINGGVNSVSAATRVLNTTGAYAVMAAQGFLENPCLLNFNHDCRTADPAFLAAEYLNFAEQYPPPSALYIRKHLRWIFRKELEPVDRMAVNFSDWRPRLWTFLVRPYLETIEQFRAVVVLYANLNDSKVPTSLEYLPKPTFRSIKTRAVN